MGEQLTHGSWQPLAFFNRQLRPAERKYSAFDRELLALYLAVRHFHYILEGRDFTAFTDHKPLTFAFAKVSDPWSAQHADQEMAAYRTAISGLVLQDVQFGPTNTTLLCDISTGQPRPIVPASFRRTVFDAIHGLSHSSIRATQKLLTDRYVWHGIRKQDGSWAKHAKRPRSSNTSEPHHRHSTCPIGDLTTSTSTSWVHYHHHRATLICSQ